MRLLPATLLLTAFLHPLHADPLLPETASSARILEISGDGWAGNSVNMLANQSSSILTNGETQYAAFYNSHSHVILARRTLGSDMWRCYDSGKEGNTADAHNTIAIAVDGAGILHMAWGHHGSPLHYARSIRADSLIMGPDEAMNGEMEGCVTYPMFFRTEKGDLLFLYRDGWSGQGNIVLKRYDTAQKIWSTVQKNLVSGEGRRSAYVAAMLDLSGTLHLAWTWRETPDVASNHDLCYACSKDGGSTWTDSAGHILSLPVTEDGAEYAAKIPQNSTLMNPPSVTAGWKGVPHIVDYWAEPGSDIPQWHIVSLENGSWVTRKISKRSEAFSLAGTETKHPPLSRALALCESRWNGPDSLWIVYRDDADEGKIKVLSAENASGPWSERALTNTGTGAWEPSCDIVQWQRLNQLHMLVQNVKQPDGNDSAQATGPMPVGSLIWSPSVASWMGRKANPLPPPDTAQLEQSLNAQTVLSTMEKCADWQLAHMPGYDPAGWECAPFYIGAIALAKISGSPRFKEAVKARCESNGWQPGKRLYDADDHCVVQAYLEMWEMEKKPAMIQPAKERFDRILANPPEASLFFGYPGDRTRWSWCDALFMGPAGWAQMSLATGDSRYIEFMDAEFRASTDYLFQPADGFYLRDNRFRDLREPNGRRIYWSRGNGWVAAGLCRVLDAMPEKHPSRIWYETLYRRMMCAVIKAQQNDGLWRPGLLDPGTHAARETSGSAFYTYALAWGVNRGLLDRKAVEPAIRHAWNALCQCVEENGKLVCVQPIGDAPQGFDPRHSEPFGTGAFLLAGSEVWRMCREPSTASGR